MEPNWKKVILECLQGQVDLDRDEVERLSIGTLVEEALISFSDDEKYENFYEENGEVVRAYTEKIAYEIDDRDDCDIYDISITDYGILAK